MQIKFVTLNLWHGGRLMDNILAFLKEQDADIVTLQEAYASTDTSLERQFRSQSVLQESLGYKYSDFAPAFLDRCVAPKPIDSGNLILSRFPIIGSDATFLNEPYGEYLAQTPEENSKLPRLLQHVQLNTPVGEVNVFNLHGVWDLDGDNFGDRRRQMRDVILQETSGKQNVLLAGDSNARPTNQAMRDLESQLTNVFGVTLTSTFNMRHKTNPGYATSSVDILYISPSIQVLAQDCPSVDISDHLPLTATLEIRQS